MAVLHVGLHQPLKRVETPQSTPRKPDIVREAREPAAAERDAGESLMGLLNQVARESRILAGVGTGRRDVGLVGLMECAHALLRVLHAR